MSFDHIEGLRVEEPCSARVVFRDGAGRLEVNGQEIAPFAAWSWGLLEAAPLYRDAGIGILHPILGLNSVWNEDGSVSLESFDALFDGLLSKHPEALFLPRILFDVPDWWMERYASELVECALPKKSGNLQYGTSRVNPEGGMRWTNPLHAPSLASDKYLDDIETVFSTLIRHFSDAPLASRILGYQIGAGVYGEWHYPLAEFMPDSSTSAVEKIGAPPPMQRRLDTDCGLFRDPMTETDVIDYFHRFHDNLIAAAILRYANLVKRESGGRLLCGCFYGYQLQNVWMQEGGHLAPEVILNSEDIDFIASPFTYQTTNVDGEPWWNHDIVDGAGNYLGRARGVGGDGGYRVMLESIRRRGKLYFVEADSGTCLMPVAGDHSGSEADVDRLLTNIGGLGSETLEGTIKILSRDLGRMWAGGSAGWLFDFGAVLSCHKSWYDHPDVRALLADFAILMEQRTRLDLSPVAEIAAVYDARTFFYTRHWRAEKPLPETGSFDYFMRWFMDSQARSLHRIGAPIDFLYRFDLVQEDLTRYKLVFVMNAFHMNAREADTLRRLFEGSDTTVVWLYAPGFSTETGLDLHAMSDLTGFRFRQLDDSGSMLISDGREGDGSLVFGVDQEEAPRFVVTEADEFTGWWTDGAGAAMATRAMPGWTSIYVGTAPLPVDLLRSLASDADVDLWSSQPDVVVATRDTAMVVAASRDSRELQLPPRYEPILLESIAGSGDTGVEYGGVRLFVGIGD